MRAGRSEAAQPGRFAPPAEPRNERGDGAEPHDESDQRRGTGAACQPGGEEEGARSAGERSGGEKLGRDQRREKRGTEQQGCGGEDPGDERDEAHSGRSEARDGHQQPEAERKAHRQDHTEDHAEQGPRDPTALVEAAPAEQQEQHE